MGSGSYGSVYKVKDKRSGKIFALKKFEKNFKCKTDAMKNNEVKILQ